MPTHLLVAAEPREFSGILRRASQSTQLTWEATFARECKVHNNRWLLAANGPGPRLVDALLSISSIPREVDAIISIGFCGALDPVLRIGAIVITGEIPKGVRAPYVQGDLVSVDRVAVTAGEKRSLRGSSGA